MTQRRSLFVESCVPSFSLLTTSIQKFSMYISFFFCFSTLEVLKLNSENSNQFFEIEIQFVWYQNQHYTSLMGIKIQRSIEKIIFQNDFSSDLG